MLKNRKRKRKVDKSIILLLVIVAVVLVTVFFGFFQLRTDLFTEMLKEISDITVLFAVSGDQEYRFFELLIYNPQTHKGAVVFVPGNVGAIIESLKRVDRIDALYRPGELQPLKRKVEEITGLEISFIVDLMERDVMDLVDLLGGLELFIPNPVDTTFQDYRVLLPSGSIVLDGAKIKDFISYQDSLESDMDRVARKQKFLQALLKKIGERSSLLLHKNTFNHVKRIIKSNFSSRALISFIREMENLDTERLIFQRVLGSSRIVDNKELLFPHFEGELLKETIKQTQETIASHETLTEEELLIAVEILNGTSVNGLARRAANVFRSFGYEVVSIGNADNDEYLKTVAIDRQGKLESAQKVAGLIRCNRVYSRLDEEMDLTIDVTLILGKDFDGRYCKE